jgi:hypothetical protein
MFSKILRAAAAAAMAFGTLGAGLNVTAAYDDCLTNAPVGYCCNTAASGPNGDPCCDIAANGPNGDPCCYSAKAADAADLTVDPCCYEGAPAPQSASNGIYVDCNVSSASVRGTAFEDKNANGKRDAGEPTMAGAWLKLSGGGSWFVCAFTGADATYGIPVIEHTMTYIIFPIAPPGWRTTTPVIKAKTVDTKNGFAYLYNDIGFVRDASVKTVEGCDQYNPSRPVPPGP